MLWLIWPTHLYRLYSRTDIPFSVWSYACGSDLICLTSPKIWSAYSRTARDVFMRANTGGSQTCRRHTSGRIQVPSETTVYAPSSPHYADQWRDLRYLRQDHRYSRRIPQPFGQDLITSVATHTSMHITVYIRPPHSHYEWLSHRDIARVMWQWRKPVFPKAKSESSSISVASTHLGRFSLSFVLFVNNLSDTLPGMGYTPLFAINCHWTCAPEYKDQGLTLLYSQSYKGQIHLQ